MKLSACVIEALYASAVRSRKGPAIRDPQHRCRGSREGDRVDYSTEVYAGRDAPDSQSDGGRTQAAVATCALENVQRDLDESPRFVWGVSRRRPR